MPVCYGFPYSVYLMFSISTTLTKSTKSSVNKITVMCDWLNCLRHFVNLIDVSVGWLSTVHDVYSLQVIKLDVAI